MANANTVEMESFTIGSSEGCELRLTSPSVNRAHAKIYFTQDTVLIEDLDSDSGTFVYHEGVFKRIKSAKIRFDTKIRFGEKMEALAAQEIIENFKAIKEKDKKDIFKKVKSVGLKRCFDCGSVIEKNKIHCDCCGAILDESA